MTRVWIPKEFATEDILRLLDGLDVDETHLWHHMKLGHGFIRTPQKEER